MKFILEVLNIFWSICLAIIAIVVSFLIPKSKKRKEVGVGLSIFSFTINFRKDTYIRGLLVLLGISFLGFTFVRDYSSFFPKRVSFEIYYDSNGLKQAIESIRPLLEDGMKISPDWENKRRAYFQELDKIIKSKIPQYELFFSYDHVEDYLVSKGKAEHVVELFRFWQQYKITKVNGLVQHRLHPPDMNPIELETRYNLLDRPKNLVLPTIRDFFRGRKLVAPTMAQSLIIHTDKVYEAEIVGLTEVRFFPYNTLEKTIFCFKSEAGLVPFSYTFYKEEE
ncbi:MAG: hypothetical protein Q8L26_04225 [Candidatus Omnitrophota bacterium]|nr:hypothetical protein [Candidatus Omnitrophota bacterium]